MMKKSILGIIPARGGSKGIKGKNIVDLCGKPLISWSIETGIELLKNETLKAKKKSVSGIFERLDILKRVGLEPLSVNLKLENNSSIKIDDVLDSMVLFITALRIVEGNHLCLEKIEITDGDNNGKIFI